MIRLRHFFIFFVIPLASISQKSEFTEQDSLRGSITKERAWWDLTYYHLFVDVDPDQKYISGSNTIHYTVIDSMRPMQIDLQPPLKISKVVQDGQELNFFTNGNVHLIELKKTQKVGDKNQLTINYNGNPLEAEFPPWDGGFTWSLDKNGKHFIATSCQGIGASIWWPNKDHMYDEVDSMRISIRAPANLVSVANGRLESLEKGEENNTTHWVVKNPINNYGVNVNIGDYVNFTDTYEGKNGTLDLNYYVLRDNVEKAQRQFKQVKPMLEAFEHWFGPYPFYEDSFKLVEVPYLGMEHQSSVTYGNQYQNGYLGRDLSRTGWGLKFDFIIVHEAGHEWFANNITNKDIADMWIHEGFTAYSENLFLDYHYGKEASADYVIGTRANIQNDRPIIGVYNVNHRGSSDMYYKGSNLLHTLRQLIEDDELWRSVLTDMNQEFYHQTVTTKQIEDFISTKTKKDLSAFFDQYLRSTDIPLLEYKIDKEKVSFRYTRIVEDFDMPVRTFINSQEKWLFPSAEWKTEEFDSNISEFEIDRNFYIDSRKL